ncbi:MAG: DUF711 family protein [Anaerolineales bacterium]
MKIRSITYFCNPKYPLDEKVIQAAGKFLAKAKSAYEAAGYEVQTVRLATIPFPKLLGEKRINELPKLAEQLEKLIGQIGVGHLSVGPALPESPRSYEVIPEAIAASQNIFFDGVMADKSIGISPAAIEACANVIVKCAPIDPNGFANLRFAALANVKAGSPFFPAAYHDNDKPAFAIATEAADLAVDAFSQAKTLEIGRQTLIADIEKHGKRLSKVAQSLDCKFGGVDFSLGPFPAEAQSLGTAFERMGVPRVGLHGSLAAAAILTEAIDRANFPRTGFSGLMMPVLEDATLAKRAADGTLSVKDVLLYSAVCGTGLDTIPLPGDTTVDQIVPLLLDLSALALRLDKPLTARLMPVPGKKAGAPTNFDFGFFANSKVMSLDSMPLNSSLAGNETFSIQSRTKRSGGSNRL